MLSAISTILQAIVEFFKYKNKQLDLENRKMVWELCKAVEEDEENFNKKIEDLRARHELGADKLADRLVSDRSRRTSVSGHILSGLSLSGEWTNIYKQHGEEDKTSE